MKYLQYRPIDIDYKVAYKAAESLIEDNYKIDVITHVLTKDVIDLKKIAVIDKPKATRYDTWLVEIVDSENYKRIDVNGFN